MSFAMTLEEDFKDAAVRVKQLSSRPSNDQLLELYALYKQGSEGDVSGKRPGMIDMKGRFKFDAWAKLKGTPKDQAMQRYVDLVGELEKSIG